MREGIIIHDTYAVNTVRTNLTDVADNYTTLLLSRLPRCQCIDGCRPFWLGPAIPHDTNRMDEDLSSSCKGVKVLIESLADPSHISLL